MPHSPRNKRPTSTLRPTKKSAKHLTLPQLSGHWMVLGRTTAVSKFPHLTTRMRSKASISLFAMDVARGHDQPLGEGCPAGSNWEMPYQESRSGPQTWEIAKSLEHWDKLSWKIRFPPGFFRRNLGNWHAGWTLKIGSGGDATSFSPVGKARTRYTGCESAREALAYREKRKVTGPRFV